MNIAEKILAAHVVGGARARLREARRRGVRARGRRLLARVHDRAGRTTSWSRSTATDYAPGRPARSSRCSRTTSSTRTASPKMAPFSPKIQVAARHAAASSSSNTGVQDYSARERRLARHLPQRGPRADHRARRLHPGHGQPHLHGRRQRTRWPTAWAPPSTRRSCTSGFTFVEVPESIRFELAGALPPGVTAKDVMLHILATPRQAAGDARPRDGVRRAGPRVARPDERATLANMATECSAKAGVVEADDETLRWIAAPPAGRRRSTPCAAGSCGPIPGAQYAGGVHTIDLAQIRPMVATPGRSRPGHPLRSRPTAPRRRPAARCAIDIAYGGSLHRGQGSRPRPRTRRS